MDRWCGPLVTAEARTVEFFGETFTLAEDVSQFALLEFAEAASDGQDGDTMEGLASMMRLVKECVDKPDVKRFLATARKNRAGTTDLIPVLSAAFEVETDRPTSRPSDSSDGPVTIAPKSPSSSDDKPSGRFDGRPDLRLALSRTA